jgi:hypothetical protein
MCSKTRNVRVFANLINRLLRIGSFRHTVLANENKQREKMSMRHKKSLVSDDIKRPGIYCSNSLLHQSFLLAVRFYPRQVVYRTVRGWIGLDYMFGVVNKKVILFQENIMS